MSAIKGSYYPPEIIDTDGNIENEGVYGNNTPFVSDDHMGIINLQGANIDYLKTAVDNLGSNTTALQTSDNDKFKTATVSDATITLTKGTGEITSLTVNNVANATNATNASYTTTQEATDNSTKIASTAFVKTAVANLVSSAPETLNTLNELATALGNDPNFATTVSNNIGAIDAKANTNASNITALQTSDNAKFKAVSASNATLTFTKGDNTTSTVTVNNVANATNATNAAYASRMHYDLGSFVGKTIADLRTALMSAATSIGDGNTGYVSFSAKLSNLFSGWATTTTTIAEGGYCTVRISNVAISSSGYFHGTIYTYDVPEYTFSVINGVWSALNRNLVQSDYDTLNSAYESRLTAVESKATTYATITDMNTKANQTSLDDLKEIVNANTQAIGTKQPSGSYLTTTDASNTYLTQENASSTYLSKTTASETYATSENLNSALTRLSTLQTQVDSNTNAITTKQPKGNYATVEYVDGRVANLVNSAPETLDTLDELANALGNDPNFATTVSTQIGQKANKADVDNQIQNVNTQLSQAITTLQNGVVSSIEGKKGEVNLWDVLHRYGENYVPTDTSNIGWNSLGVCIIYYTENVIKNQPTKYGQLINIPANTNTESTQIWVSQYDGRMYTRGGNTDNSVNDRMFIPVGREDRVYLTTGAQIWVE